MGDTSEMASARSGRALILVVERDPQTQRLERYFLEQAGFGVEFASDGRKGLELARELVPDIVVAEILVGGMDGLTVCRTLKAEPATSNIIVLIFSILAAAERARAAGADAFVRKPLGDERLVASVEALLAQHGRGGLGDGSTQHR